MALTVTQRTREMGIRFALGASRGDVLRLVLGQGAVLVGIGLAAGLLGAFVASRALRSVLYDVAPLDPAALISALLTLSLVALIACFLPARRASRIQPEFHRQDVLPLAATAVLIASSSGCSRRSFCRINCDRRFQSHTSGLLILATVPQIMTSKVACRSEIIQERRSHEHDFVDYPDPSADRGATGLAV